MTLYPIVRLEGDGIATLQIDVAAGVYAQALDLGDAVTRPVMMDAPDADGTIDTTAFVGARNVTLSVILNPDVNLWSLRQQLRSFTAPRLRPIMYVQLAADAPEQRIQLRRSQYSDVIGDAPRQSTQDDPEAAAITVQWVAPFGILESSDLHVANIFASGGATAGRTYSLTFSRTYPPSAAIGSGTVNNAGNTDAYPLIRIYGPATEPALDNDTQGKSLAFVGLTLAAGEFLEIDTRTKTILLNGDPANSRYDKLSYPASEWWSLSPGDNLIRFHPTTYTAATTVAEISWRDAYL